MLQKVTNDYASNFNCLKVKQDYNLVFFYRILNEFKLFGEFFW